LVRRNTDEADSAIQELRTLIIDYHFVPVLDLSHKLIGESIYMLSNLDLSLIRDMVVHNGFCLSHWNDTVMERLMATPVSLHTIQSYVDVGFCLSDVVVKRAIALGKPYSFELLNSLVSQERLQKVAEDTVYELFGPYLDRESSLNVPWNSFAVQRIIQQYRISDQVIERALLECPEETCTFEKVHANFPVTRPYLKSKPYAIWKFILENYGPHHRFTMACFDDAISRAVADQSLHHLIDTFLDSGVVLRPRHVKILACRVLHRNMTANALKLMVHLRKQIVERYRKAIQLNYPQDHITQIHQEELRAFAAALKVDMLDNQEWKERSRTVQLGGGTSGGAFRIDRAPQDVVRFIEEGTLLAQFIAHSDYKKTDTKERKPKSSVGNLTFFRRIKMYANSNVGGLRNYRSILPLSPFVNKSLLCYPFIDSTISFCIDESS
jgi:hypothetical protein